MKFGRSYWKILLVGSLCLLLTACTYVRDNDDDEEEVPVGNNGTVVNNNSGDSTVVDALVVVELSRGSANLMNGYYDYLSLVEASLLEQGVEIRNIAVAPMYRQQSLEPPLLYGRGDPDNFSDSLAETLAYYVSDTGLAHLDGSVEAPGENLAALGMNLDQEPIFNPEMSSPEARAYFDEPEDGFLVFHFTGTERPCSHSSGDCSLNGEKPSHYFTDSDDDGNVSWLRLPGPSSLPKSEIVHVSLATAEGVGFDTFSDDCTSEPNFPTAYLDFLSPSDNTYFGPFISEIEDRGGAGIDVDLCIAFSSRAASSAVNTANQIAQKVR